MTTTVARVSLPRERRLAHDHRLVDCRLPRPARHRAPLGVAVTAAAIVSALALTGSAPALAAAPSGFGTPTSVTVPSGVANADGIAVSGGVTYLLDAQAKKVLALDASGNVTASTGTMASLNAPVDIAVSPVNPTKLFIADAGGNQVVSLTLPISSSSAPLLEAGTSDKSQGTPSGTGSSPTLVGLSNPQGIAVDASENLYIADTGNKQVEKVSGTGASRMLTVIAGALNNTGTPPTSTPALATSATLTSPKGVAVDNGGAVYISESMPGRIDKIAAGSTQISQLATVAGATSLDVGGGFAYVASGTSVTAVDTSTGTVTPAFGPTTTSADAVRVASTGAVWIADANGSSSKVWTVSPASGAGQAPVITSSTTLTVPTGTPLSRALTATGSPTSWSVTATPTAGWLTISPTGVLSGTPVAGTYSVLVTASNSAGLYNQTITLNVGDAPAAPAAAPKATAGQGSAVVTWAAPTPSASPSASSTVSGAITGYVITPYVGTTKGTPVTAAAGATSTVVSGLTSGTAYTFTVAATNAFGAGAASAASTAVTPFGGFVQPAAGLTRYEGGTRVQTAVSVSQKLFPGTGSSRAVVIASSTNYADSLAGARLASAVGGPLLLTDPLALNTEVASEVARVLAVPAAAAAGSTPAASAGSAPSQTAVGTVYLLGGTSAVSAAVETAVKAVNAKYTVTRISGTDRFDTAVKIAAQTAADDGGASAPIYVASGTNYPDGLAVAALAARTGGVVLLTDGSKMPDATLKYLQTYDPNSELLVAVGGPAAKATSGHGADRAVIGTDRYDTARRVAELFTAPTGSAPVRSVGLATGDNWPDALAGAAAMGNLDGPLLLTPSGALSPSTSSALTALAKKGRPTSALVFGGSSVVSTGTANDFTSGATR